jgi:hypothetical protein
MLNQCVSFVKKCHPGTDAKEIEGSGVESKDISKSQAARRRKAIQNTGKTLELYLYVRGSSK